MTLIRTKINGSKLGCGLTELLMPFKEHLENITVNIDVEPEARVLLIRWLAVMFVQCFLNDSPLFPPLPHRQCLFAVV